MKRYLTIFSIILLIILAFTLHPAPVAAPTQNIKLLIADTPQLQELGLGQRDSLATDTAMLFVFDTPDQHAFWMKDMRFPIDMIWIDQNRTIVHIESSVSPQSYPTVFTPTEKSLYVLETNAGFAEKNNLKVGNELQFDIFSKELVLPK